VGYDFEELAEPLAKQSVKELQVENNLSWGSGKNDRKKTGGAYKMMKKLRREQNINIQT
jgi:hypothetical protein